MLKSCGCYTVIRLKLHSIKLHKILQIIGLIMSSKYNYVYEMISLLRKNLRNSGDVSKSQKINAKCTVLY